MDMSHIPLAVFNGIGVVGFGLYVLNYTLLTLRYFNGNDLSYFVINLIAATFVLTSLMASFNLASVLIQIFWMAMSLLGIIMRINHPRNQLPRAS